MSEVDIPHFHNNAGLPLIRVSVRKFLCMGAKPPFDHPHIFINMGDEDEKICPYCSTRFQFEGALSPNLCAPRDALWVEPAQQS